MGFLGELFGRKKVTTRELKTQLMRIERDRRKKRMEIKKLETRQGRLIDQLKEARKGHNPMEVDYLWEDLKALKIDKAMLMREATVLNLEGITVKNYVRGMERMEKNKNHEGINKLVERMRSSGLEAKLDAEKIATDEYLDELRAIMDNMGADLEVAAEAEEDPEKARFLAEIDAINAAEETGHIEEALEKEEKLRQKVEEPAEDA